MKKILAIFLCLLSFMLVSCGDNKASQKAIEDGKTALVNQEYEKAKEFFETALKEDGSNTTASDFLDLSNNYIELLDIIKNEDFDDLDEVLSEIESNKELELIKEDYEIVKKNALKKKEALEKENKKPSKQETINSSNKVNEDKNKNETSSNESNKENSKEEEVVKKEESKPESNVNNSSNKKVTAEQAVEKARGQWAKDNKDPNLKDVVFNDDPALNENNEYVIGVCSVHGEYKTVGVYYVNASTGEVRLVRV